MTCTHTWRPIEGRMAQYDCACGATAYRARNGELIEHKEKLRRTVRWTVGEGHTGRVPVILGSDKQFERKK